MKCTLKSLMPALFILSATTAHAYNLPKGEVNLSLGSAYVNQGQNQLININKSFGNIHTVTHQNDTVFLAGAGYLFDAFKKAPVDVSFGASIYYLSPAKVQGLVFLERTFPNLVYEYKTTNIPLYAQAKGIWNGKGRPFDLVVDVGVGPNFIKTHDYNERSIDGGVSIPNQAFRGKTEVKLSAMAGISFRLNQLFKDKRLEVGYKYFYLNEGTLNPRSQVLTHLKTSNVDAHALTLTLIA